MNKKTHLSVPRVDATRLRPTGLWRGKPAFVAHNATSARQGRYHLGFCLITAITGLPVGVYTPQIVPLCPRGVGGVGVLPFS